MIIPAAIRDVLQPLPGQIYVQRKERPDRYGRILLPDSVVKLRRSAEATVTASSSPLYRAGQVVLVAQGVGRRIEFDDRVSLYIASEMEILALLERVDVDPEVDYPQAHPRMEADDDERVDEGEGFQV